MSDGTTAVHRLMALRSLTGDEEINVKDDYYALQQYKLDGSNFRFFQKATVGAMATLGKALMQNGKQ